MLGWLKVSDWAQVDSSGFFVISVVDSEERRAGHDEVVVQRTKDCIFTNECWALVRMIAVCNRG